LGARASARAGRPRRARALALAAAGACAAAACGACGAGAAADAPARGVAVRGAWARPTAAPNAAAYLTVVNHTPEVVTITAARSPAAAAVTLHETMTMGAGAHAMAHMVPLPQVGLAPGDSAVFAPGGKHLMLERLRAPLTAGARVPLTLVTADGVELRVEVEVRAP
jgi:hypothetical protein